MYANKVNGATVVGESLSSSLDFFTVTSPVNILTAATTGGSATSQAALDKLVEVVSLRGQPIIINAPYQSDANGNANATGAAYTFKFATEHTGQWAQGTDLANAIAANQTSGMGFVAANITVTIGATLYPTSSF